MAKSKKPLRANPPQVPARAPLPASPGASYAAHVEPGNSVSTLASRASLFAWFLLALIVFGWAGIERPFMDADEGHFLSAIRMVSQGHAPCRDFFYQQTPLFPYPYAVLMRLFGASYWPQFWLSVGFATGLAVVVARYFQEQSRSIAIGWVGWALVVANANIVFWGGTIKNHSMPLFFGALGIWAASRKWESGGRAFAWAALAGAAAVVSVGSRLPAAPLAAVAVVWVILRAISMRLSGIAWAGIGGMAVGAGVPLLLILRSALPDFDVFRFDILGFHAVRTGGGNRTYGNWYTISTRLLVLLKQVQFPALVVIAIAAAGCAIRNSRTGLLNRMAPSLLAAAGLGTCVLNLMPFETFTQYFMVPAVLFIFASAPLWEALWQAQKRVPMRAAAVALGGGYVAFAANHREDDFRGLHWDRASIMAMSEALASATRPGDVVLSGWQGFAVLADRPEVAGNENYNSRVVTNGNSVPVDMMRRLRIATNDELSAMLDRAEPKAIMIGFFTDPFYKRVLCEMGQRGYVVDQSTGWFALRPQIRKNYTLVKQIGTPVAYSKRFLYGVNQLWVRNDPGP